MPGELKSDITNQSANTWHYLPAVNPEDFDRLPPLSDDEIRYAFFYWLRSYRFRENDAIVEPYLSEKISGYEGGPKSWLKLNRDSLLLSINVMAKRLEVTPSAYAKMEKSEMRGTLTLRTLERAANAMDCELVYAIRPKSRRTFSIVIRQDVLQSAREILRKRSWNCHTRKMVLSSIARDFMTSAKFRRSKSWSLRKIDQPEW